MNKRHSRGSSTSPLKKTQLKKLSTSSNNDRMTIVRNFVGAVLQSNYVIGSQIGIGSFGQVYEAIDMKRKDVPLVVKFSSNLNLAQREIEAMQTIWEEANNKKKLDRNRIIYTPRIYGSGFVIKEATQGKTSRKSPRSSKDSSSGEKMSYYIMPRFGQNLEQYFDQQERNLSKSSIYSLGIALLNILEQIHDSGYIYNDLKLDNLLIGYNDQLPSEYCAGNCFEYVNISIVDFGFVTRYIDEANQKHLPVQNVKVFRGNIMFASPN